MAVDLSRHATDFRKGYDGVRMQQGRVLTDDDFNEAARLHAEALRRTRLETIGAYGSPDQGFLPKNLVVEGENGRPSFDLSRGTLYVGGLRLELGRDEPFHAQSNWLSFASAKDAPPALAEGGSRIDLVWIEAWQQPVTAVEDAELLESALGGPDTTTRIRTMCRVKVLAGVGTGICEDAWQKACREWAAEGTIADDREVVGTARLRVEYAQPEEAVCTPAMPGGYLGAANQAIRVRTISPEAFIWSFDNAAPLYRAYAGEKTVTQRGETVTEIFLVTSPRDELHYPAVNQLIELLPWGAELPNGQKVAESGGVFAEVAQNYDPDSKRFTVKGELGEPFKNSTAKEMFFCLRIWRTDSSLTAGGIPLSSGKLGQTGLTVSFKGEPRPGDFWIIAARPAAPDAVSPWSIDQRKNGEGMPPHGIKRYRAPVALIRWQNGSEESRVIQDCRAPYIPLTASWWWGGCSIVIAPRPGWERFFSQLSQIPQNDISICFQPGEYTLHQPVILQKQTVKITGAGSGTKITAVGCETAFLFRNCDSVIVRDLYVATAPAPQHSPVTEQHLNGALDFRDCTEVEVADCHVCCPDAWARQQSCVTVNNATSAAKSVRVLRNRFQVGCWQTGLLIVNANLVAVSSNHLFIGKAQESQVTYRGVPEHLVGTVENVVLDALTDAEAGPAVRKVVFKKSQNSLNVLTSALAAPLVVNFATHAPEDVDQSRNGVDGALSSFARKVAAGDTSWLSDAGKAALGEIVKRLRAGSQGIVVAGAKAGTVQLADNVVEDMMQGIHVGVSTRATKGPDQVEEVVLSRNVVHSLIPQLFNRDRHGIFIGNARSISICDTVATLQRLGDSDKTKETAVEAVRIRGVLGPYLVVRQSSFRGFKVGVAIQALDPIPKKRLWLVADTMAVDAESVYKAEKVQRPTKTLPIDAERNF